MFDMASALTNDTFRKAMELCGAQRAGNPLAKVGIDLATGITGYNLEAPAKLLVSFLAPFAQSIPDVSKPGQAANWKRITGVSAGSLFPGEGTAGNQISLVTDAKAVTYVPLARGGKVTWEAQQGSLNYEDARNRSETLTLLDFLLNRERAILGGNVSALADPTVATPLKTVTTGGFIGTGTYKALVVALTAEGYGLFTGLSRSKGGTDYDVDATLITPAWASGVTAAITSAAVGVGPGTLSAASAAGSGSTNKLVLTWTAVKNAVAYMVFVDDGTTGTIASLVCQCILPAQTKVQLTKLRTTGTITVTGSTATADFSANTKAFDGIMQQINASGSGAYTKALGAKLSAAVGIQIPELRDAMQAIWDKVRGQEIARIVTGPVEATSIDLTLQGVTNDRIHVVYNPGVGGPQFEKAKFYPSPISGKQIPIEINPNLPGGVILGLTDAVNLPNSEIPACWAMQQGSPFIRIDYAMSKTDGPNYNHEVRSFEALAGYAPLLNFILYDVHPS